MFETVEGIRKACGKDFLLGVRLSPEKFGLKLQEIKEICRRLIDEGTIDFLDISLWDSFKFPEEEDFNDKPLLEHFTALDFKKVLLTVAGNIKNGSDVIKVLNSGVDFVTIGRSGILHHDFPAKVIGNHDFKQITIPVSKNHLRQEGLGEKFINYLRGRLGFVKLDS